MGRTAPFMKRNLFAFRWVIASLIFGLGTLGLLMTLGLYLPSGTEVTSEALSRKALYTGLTFWIFLVIVPLIALIFAIRELSTSGQAGKPVVEE